MEFERAAPPPPPPSAEATADIESAILKRIAEGLFDDPPRFSSSAAPGALKKNSKETTEIDDRAPEKGLGELYEREYLEEAARRKAAGEAGATGGLSNGNDPALAPEIDDGHGKTRAEARAVAGALFARLDALCHMRHAPDLPGVDDDVDEEALSRAAKVGLAAGDAPALAAEEALPLAASAADARTPAEVWAPEKRHARGARGEKPAGGLALSSSASFTHRSYRVSASRAAADSLSFSLAAAFSCSPL